MNLGDFATRIEKAALSVSIFANLRMSLLTALQTIAEGKSITGDLGGKASTSEYTSAIIAKLK